MLPSAGALAGLALILAACGGRASTVREPERGTPEGAVRPEWGPPQPGDPAPDFELPVVGGGTFRLSSLQGSWVFLHFTASWCPFCDAEVEHLGEVARQYESRGVKVIVVDIKEPLAHWTKYAAAHVGPSVIDLHDATGAMAARYAPPRMQPSFQDRSEVVLDSSLLIDRKGTIRLFVMPDSAHFDPTFKAVRASLDGLLAAETNR
jgi:peroxiredoxin Q/BCP